MATPIFTTVAYDHLRKVMARHQDLPAPRVKQMGITRLLWGEVTWLAGWPRRLVRRRRARRRQI